MGRLCYIFFSSDESQFTTRAQKIRFLQSVLPINIILLRCQKIPYPSASQTFWWRAKNRYFIPSRALFISKKALRRWLFSHVDGGQISSYPGQIFSCPGQKMSVLRASCGQHKSPGGHFFARGRHFENHCPTLCQISYKRILLLTTRVAKIDDTLNNKCRKNWWHF